MGEEKKKQKYLTKRDNFLREKSKLLGFIESYEKDIKHAEDRINEIRPKTDNGELICPKCDCVSMEYKGRKRKFVSVSIHDDAIDGYICEICDYKLEKGAGMWRGD